MEKATARKMPRKPAVVRGVLMGKATARKPAAMQGVLMGKGTVSGSATLSLTFPSAKLSKAAYDALLSEADFSHRGGSCVSLSGKSVRVEIKADDPVSLRASLNSYLRLMHIIKSVEENTE